MVHFVFVEPNWCNQCGRLTVDHNEEEILDCVVAIEMNPRRPPHANDRKKRQEFTDSTRNARWRIEYGCCEHCKQFTDVEEFDHRNDDSSDNSLGNCQLLCPNCHARKHRKKKLTFSLANPIRDAHHHLS